MRRLQDISRWVAFGSNAWNRVKKIQMILPQICTITTYTNPFMSSGFFYHNYFQKQSIWLFFFFYYVLQKFQYLMQTVKTLIRCHLLQYLIWICTVCQLPFGGFPNLNGLKIIGGIQYIFCLISSWKHILRVIHDVLYCGTHQKHLAELLLMSTTI